MSINRISFSKTQWLILILLGFLNVVRGEEKILTFEEWHDSRGPHNALRLDGKVESIKPESGSYLVTLQNVRLSDPAGGSDRVERHSSFRWNCSIKPIPICVGMDLFAVMLDAHGNCNFLVYGAIISYWRKSPSGLVETILGFQHQEERKLHYLYVQLDRISEEPYAYEVFWDSKWGVVLAITDRGSDMLEPELFRARDRSLPLENTKEINVIPGRDGWNVMPQEDASGSTKAYADFLKGVPKRQLITPPAGLPGSSP